MKNFLKNEKTKKIFFDILYPLIAFALVIAIWAIVAKVKNKPLILPSPDVVLKKFFTLGGEAGFWRAVGFSVLRTLWCFAASFLAIYAFYTTDFKFFQNPAWRL